ncbi:MAG: FtsX-like permease family protein [Oscillospiraceae bacterium]
MKRGFYPRLAWSGMRKNSKLYLPYTLACIGMTAMFYILMHLADSPALKLIPSSGNVAAILSLGTLVMGVFSLLFLFYTNSFLVRRRYKEFGLYNVLGMNKGNISRVLAWEALINALISLVGGLFLGIALSKLAELGLVNIMGGDVDLDLRISVKALEFTVMFFCGIFLLIYINSLIKIRRSSASELVKSENFGEKPPRANWLFGLAGIVILAAAYYIAVSIKTPLTALSLFFIAVIMVIVATYLIFIAGSVWICRLLQKNKRYYYKKNHFVSVSSMVYRMKRNGAGLASICILATMVLVMISSTTCLYFGTEGALSDRYPRDISISASYSGIDSMTDENISALRSEISAAVGGAGTENILDYRCASLAGSLENGVLDPSGSVIYSTALTTYDYVAEVRIVPLADYNAMAGTNESLGSDEAMIYAYRMDYTDKTFAVDDLVSFRVKKMLDSFPVGDGSAMASIAPTVYVIVPDFTDTVAKLGGAVSHSDDEPANLSWNYAFDTPVSDEEETAMCERIGERLSECGESGGYLYYSRESLAENRADFYGMYGGLFFLGIMLSIAFICAAVLIIYYKQISEGYEDRRRFEIMQNVGMTKKEIRSSINSQLLTVFFLPLIFAGLHLGFAFPFIHKLLMLFNLSNLPLLIGTTAISFGVFALLYAVVYRVTSNAYYNIVS